MLKQSEIKSCGHHRAMTVIAHVHATVRNLQKSDSVLVSHVQLFDGSPTSHQQLHAAIHRACPPGWKFTSRAVSDGIIVYRET